MRLASSRRAAAALAVLASALLTACASQHTADSLFGLITPYRIEVVQGNVVTREMAANVRPGMSRAQVRDALGSPLLTDIFHADRWDYVFTIRRQGTPYQQRRVTVFFDGEVMKSIEAADELPSEREFVVSIDTARTRSSKQPKLSLDEEQLRALPAPKAAVARSASASGPDAAGPLRSYPPLETAQ